MLAEFLLLLKGNKMTKINMLVGCLVLAVSSASLNVHAENKTPGSGPNPFSDCGIGAALFKDTKWAAVSSNVIWDIGTTAVTSATASPETCTGANVVAAKFIIDNYDNIVEELAEGEGNYLASMYNVLGCGEIAQPTMTSAIRSEMASSISQSDYKEKDLVSKSSHLYSVVNNTATLNSCSAS